MIHLEQCPICGGQLVMKIITKVVSNRSKDKSETLDVSADVCLSCGEQLYSMDTGTQFDDIRTRLCS